MLDKTCERGGAILPSVNWLSNDVVKVLWFLLPGFVASWVFSGLTRHPKLSEFEQVIEALIFTAFTQVAVIVVRWVALLAGRLVSIGPWSDDVQLVWSLAVALLAGVAFAWSANHDVLHSWLRDLRFRGRVITKQSGYPSEWFRAFNEKGKTYITLHLRNGKRLRGWVEEWSVGPEKGHLTVQRAGWLDDNDKYTPWPTSKHVLVPVSEVSLVEFMDPALLEYGNGGSSEEVKTT
jgi:hypothetical protein